MLVLVFVLVFVLVCLGGEKVDGVSECSRGMCESLRKSQPAIPQNHYSMVYPILPSSASASYVVPCV